jgi:hypothetical protein
VEKHGLLDRSVNSLNGRIITQTSSWYITKIWGFEIIEGERKYVRRTQFTGPKGKLALLLLFISGLIHSLHI